MSIIESGKVVETITLVLLAVATVYFLRRASRGKPEPLRMMAQMEAVSQGVDRAVEEGKPVFISIGAFADLSGMYATMSAAGMNVMRYTARLCVRKGARPLFCAPIRADVLPLIDGVYREVCVAEGRPEAYDRENVVYFGDLELTFMSGVYSRIVTEGCSCFVDVGALTSSDCYPLSSASARGALIISGTPRYTHQGRLAVYSDYPLFCDDIFAAGAIASGDLVITSTIAAEDIAKWALVIVTIVSIVLGLTGFPVVGKIGWLFL